MPLYTLQDIVDDIKSFEGFDVTPSRPMNSGILYSQCFSFPLGKTKLVNDFHYRFKDFTKTNCYPPIDRIPDETIDGLFLYEIHNVGKDNEVAKFIKIVPNEPSDNIFDIYQNEQIDGVLLLNADSTLCEIHIKSKALHD